MCGRYLVLGTHVCFAKDLESVIVARVPLAGQIHAPVCAARQWLDHLKILLHRPPLKLTTPRPCLPSRYISYINAGLTRGGARARTQRAGGRGRRLGGRGIAAADCNGRDRALQFRERLCPAPAPHPHQPHHQKKKNSSSSKNKNNNIQTRRFVK
jgi:hypothetical protein